jgi:hypothetical protein
VAARQWTAAQRWRAVPLWTAALTLCATRVAAEPAPSLTPPAADVSEVARPGPFTRLQLRSDVFGRLNPIGALVRSELAYQRGERTDSALPNSFLEAGAAAGVNASFLVFGVHAAWQPAPFFTLRAAERLTRHFGSAYTLHTFASRDAPYGDDVLHDESRLSDGWQEETEIEATLRAVFGPFFVSSMTRGTHVFFTPQGPYFLDFARDLLVARSDVVLSQILIAQYLFWREPSGGSLGVGPFYELTHAFESGAERQRVGPLVSYRTDVSEWGQGRGYLALGFNLVDRNRAEELMAQVGVGWDFTL